MTDSLAEQRAFEFDSEEDEYTGAELAHAQPVPMPLSPSADRSKIDATAARCSVCSGACDGASVSCGQCAAIYCHACDSRIHASSAPAALHFRHPLHGPSCAAAAPALPLLRDEDDGSSSDDDESWKWQALPLERMLLAAPRAEEKEETLDEKMPPSRAAMRALALMPRASFHPALHTDPYARPAVAASATARRRLRPASASVLARKTAALEHALPRPARSVLRPASARGNGSVSARGQNFVPVPPAHDATVAAASTAVTPVAASPRQRGVLSTVAIVEPPGSRAAQPQWGSRSTPASLLQLHTSISALKTRLTLLTAQRHKAQVALLRGREQLASLHKGAHDLKRQGSGIARIDPRAVARQAAQRRRKKASSSIDATQAKRLEDEIQIARDENYLLRAEIDGLVERLSGRSNLQRESGSLRAEIASLRAQLQQAQSDAAQQQARHELARFKQTQLAADLRSAQVDLTRNLSEREQRRAETDAQVPLLRQQTDALEQEYDLLQMELDRHVAREHASARSSTGTLQLQPRPPTSRPVSARPMLFAPQPPHIPRPPSASRSMT